MTRPPPQKLIYWENATPQDFMEAQIGDWIQYVGDITTQYELKFIRNFGGFWSSRSHSDEQIRREERERVLDELADCFLSGSIIYEGKFIHKTIKSLRGEQPGEYANAQGCRK